MRIAEIDDALVPAYDEFLRGQGDALFYASGGFRRLMLALLGGRDRYLACLADDGRIEAVLPAFLSRPGRYGPVLNSLPFYGSNGGLVGAQASAEARRALVDAYGQIAREEGCAAATLVSSPFDRLEALSWYRRCLPHDTTDSRVGQVTFLPASGDALADFIRERCHLMVRRAIEKARKSGIEVRATDASGLPFLREVHEENMRMLGGIPKQPAFFELVAEKLSAPADYRVFTAYRSGEPVAALLVFIFNRTVEYYTPAIRESARTWQPLSLIVFEAMRDAIGRGCTRWNWGGTWATQEGVYAFKKRWAAEDRPYVYFTRVFRRELRRSTKAEILAEYPYFYVLPFAELAPQPA